MRGRKEGVRAKKRNDTEASPAPKEGTVPAPVTTTTRLSKTCYLILSISLGFKVQQNNVQKKNEDEKGVMVNFCKILSSLSLRAPTTTTTVAGGGDRGLLFTQKPKK